jgi:hypothetical protein
LEAITDVKLKKAVTPLLVPVNFSLAPRYFGLYILDHLIWFIRSFTETGNVEGFFIVPEHTGYLLADSPSGLLRVLLTIIDLIVVVFTFMCIRIFAEFIIIAFGIVKTVKSIETKT